MSVNCGCINVSGFKGCQCQDQNCKLPPNNMYVIDSWKKYANRIQQQFDNLLVISYRQIQRSKIRYCPHNKNIFKKQEMFLVELLKFINNDDRDRNLLNTCTLRYGICVNCAQKLIIKTNGLNNIFINIEYQINYPLRFKLYRTEFNNIKFATQSNPLFVKCILLKSNIHCLSKIFNLFFIKYLKETNLQKLIFGNDTNESNNKLLFQCCDPSNPVMIFNNNINICKGFEHSLCSLSGIIAGLLPHLKLFHIKCLFVDNKGLNKIAFILNKFIKDYCNLPHIKIFKQKSIRIRSDIYRSHILKQYPLIRRFMEIIWMLYYQFDSYYKKLKLKNHKHHKQILDSMKKLRNNFQGFMKYNKMKNMNAKNMSDSEYIWSLSVCFKIYNRRIFYEQSEMIPTYCSVCNWNKRKEFKKCSHCRLTYYCSKKCQKYDWNVNKHKLLCNQLFNLFTSV